MSAQRLKRVLWTTLAALILFCGLLGVTLGLLLYHPAGPQWALELIRSTTPLTIQVEAYEGRLAGPLVLRGLQVDDNRYGLRIDALTLDWRPAALLGGELHLLRIDVEDGRLQLASDRQISTPSDSVGFHGLALPLAVRLDQLELSALVIERPDAEPLQIERLTMVAHSQAGGIALQRLDLLMPQLVLHGQGEVGLAASLPMNLNLSWRYLPPQRTPLQGEGIVTGDLRHMQLKQTFRGKISGTLLASLHDLTGAVNWDARVKLGQSEMGEWLGGFPLSLNGELNSQGSSDRIDLQADLTLLQPDYGKASLSLQGEYADGRFLAEGLRIETPAGSHIEGSGRYTPDDALGRFQADLTWQDLRWPLQGDRPQVRSPQGSLRLSGTPAAYDYDLNARLQPMGQPLAELKARGTGNMQGVRLDELSADFEPGRLRGNGEVVWQPALGWKLELTGEDLDPANWHADFPGRLRLNAQTEGRMETTGVTAAFRLKQLQGRLRGYPFKAEGKAKLAGQTLDLDGLRINSGTNLVELAGTVTQQLALSWRIDAPELAAFWPGLGGRLKGQGRLDGPRETPRLRATLNGEGLSFRDNKTKALRVVADIDLLRDGALSLELRGEDLRLEAGNWSRLDLQASGSVAGHRLRLALMGEDAPQLSLRADAGWSDEKQWQGRLESLELSLPKQPVWRLASAGGFALGLHSQRLEQLCLASGDGGLCGAFSHTTAAGWDANLNARAFPLAMLSPWLPEGLQLDGDLELQAKLAVDGDGRSQGEWRLQFPRGRIGLDLESEAQRIDFGGGELRGQIDKERADLNLGLPLAGLGEIEGVLTLAGFDPLARQPGKQPLQGRLGLRVTDLSKLSLISPRLRNPRGQILGDFNLAGTLLQPQLLGSVDLREGAMDIPELGLELRGIDLRLSTPNRDQVSLEGTLLSGKGRLQLTGELALDAQAGFPASLRLTGEALKVANLPEAEVEITPDLTVEWDPQGTRLQGRIEIPYARLRPRRLPSSAVSVSPDLVVVGGGKPERRTIDPRLSAQLRVTLGDRVSFDGFGLRGKLVGSLLVIDEPKRPVIGRGRVGITDGTYRAYGQDLTIERGFALFVDNPVDNPGLDVRAVREIDEVTAGIRVSGTLKEPKIDLFSSPGMSEIDILSYLQTGRPAGSGGAESVGVAAALKATGAGTVGEELGRHFGLEELRLDTSSGLEEASVVAGTYLSPRLYIQYINELSSRETKLRIRYDINRRLQLEAETGKTQAGDLYYTFDR